MKSPPRTCAYPPCQAQATLDDAGWSTRVRTQWTLDPTEHTGGDITYDLCPEHSDYQPAPLDVEPHPLWDPAWGPVPEWVIEERHRRAEEQGR